MSEQQKKYYDHKHMLEEKQYIYRGNIEKLQAKFGFKEFEVGYFFKDSNIILKHSILGDWFGLK